MSYSPYENGPEHAPENASAPAPHWHRSAAHVLLAHDVGLLVIRLGVGLIVAARGAQHLFGWWGGLGIDKTAVAFAQFGYPAPKAMAVIAGIAETFGGLGLAVGLLTPLAGAAVAGTMANAVAASTPLGYFGGFEFPLLVGVGAAGLALSGAGRISLDALLPVLRSQRLIYGIALLVLAAILATVTILLSKN
ncbi:DoxX family protein [Streptomyces sp. DSM 41524]|uniref:DoxX family protein n=1 Tax=Streptomyces asiaticus subsp. ignotus TaxID=3098222 RepID=A0ABU7PMY3_9ACTN|nr:DoxX family protein [Streptomyces sp. DASNCL29]MEE4590427.1 DoxX family protein [Streptomyces sp. DSM 41524]TMU97049.1 DoxX family protein [Streptomyces sp. DASNCL29]